MEVARQGIVKRIFKPNEEKKYWYLEISTLVDGKSILRKISCFNGVMDKVKGEIKAEDFVNFREKEVKKGDRTYYNLLFIELSDEEPPKELLESEPVDMNAEKRLFEISGWIAGIIRNATKVRGIESNDEEIAKEIGELSIPIYKELRNSRIKVFKELFGEG